MTVPLASGSIALVTGAAGFIGGALVDALVAQGVRVRCLTRTRPRSVETRRDVEWHVVEWIDPRAIERSPALEGVQYVFHLAGVTKALRLDDFRAGNVRPTEVLLAALVRRAVKIERFVLVSSQSAAGPAASLAAPRQELDVPTPIDEYGRSKLEAERVVEAYGSTLPWTIVRPSSVYGPRDVDFLAVFRQVGSGFWIYPATRDRWLSIAYVDDVVRGVLAAATHQRAVGRAYFLAGEPPVTWRDVYRAAGEARGVRRLVELDLPQTVVNVAGLLGDVASRLTGKVGLVNSRKVALGRAKYWVCSTERARDELGLSFSTSLEEGMSLTERWYRDRGLIERR